MLRCSYSLVLFLASSLALAGAAPWLDDLDEAKRVSAATGKPILVAVVASDWSLPSQRMETEVFSLPEFSAAAPARYVLVKLDFPRTRPLAERLRLQNEAFAARVPFDAFPTTFLLDAQGTPFGKHTGEVLGGVPAFLAQLARLETQKAPLDQLVAALAKSSPGTDRARAQDTLYRQAEAWGLEARFGDLPVKIVQEDRDGKAGLKPRYQVYNAYQRWLVGWTAQDDLRKPIADLADLAARAAPWPDLRQRILFTLGMAHLNALDDEIGAREAFRLARDLDPKTEHGQKASDFLNRLP